MKLPDLTSVEEGGLHELHGNGAALKGAADSAKLRYMSADLGHADGKSALFQALDKGLHLPEHFGSNWDALADVLEDRDWLGKRGAVIRLAGSDRFRKAHPQDWTTLEEILSEAAEFWHERHVPFWIFVD